MYLFKYRAWPVLLVLLFLICGICPVPVPYFQGNAAAVADPDLIVNSITWTPVTPSISQTMIFTINIKNAGASPSGSFYVESYIDDEKISNNYVNPINAGSEMSYVFTWKAKAGDHIVRAVCDGRDDVRETNEENNDKTYAFSVLAPDLVIDRIEWTPLSPSIDQKTDFTVTVKNQGNKLATASSLILTLDGSSMGNRNIGSLEPGQTATATYSAIAASGEHTVEALADVLEQVKESDESNNSRAGTFFAAMPDLVIDKITWSPVNRKENENVDITITVKNIGSGKAGFSSLGFYLDEICQTAIFIDALSVNATSVKTISLPVDAYEHTLKAIADAAGVLGESDETNNVLSIIMPALAPDLIIQSITWSPSKPLLDQYTDFNVTVKNKGKKQAGRFEVSFYVEYYHKSTQFCSSLDAGATIEFTFPWKTQKESVSVKAIVDESNYISESNENNNTSTASIGVSPPVPNTDLSIVSIACNPDNPSLGDAVNITVAVRNNGPGSAPPSHVAYYMDDILLDSVYVREMSAGSTNTIDTIIWYAEYGVHELKIVIDCNNTVFESNENNNEKTVTLTTTAADLVIKDITWWPTNPGIGEEVIFSLTIKNQGNSKTSSSYLTYYVDGLTRGNHFIDDMEAGATITRTYTWKMQAASHVFKAVIDEANDIPESQDYNNEKTVVLPAPDLLVTEIICSPENPSENSTITFTVNFSNHGEGASPETRAVYYLDGYEYASLDIGEIQPGMTATDNLTWLAKAGKHVLKAVADGTNLFVETNESNNAKEVVLFVPLTSTIGEPVPTPASGDKTEPASTPSPTSTVATQKIDKTVKPTTTTTTPPVIEDIYPEADENIPETSAEDNEPMWKKILMNRLLIIAVAVVGLATISVLLVLRKRTANTENGEKPPKEKPPKKNPPAEKSAGQKPPAQKPAAQKPPVQGAPSPKPAAQKPPVQNPPAQQPASQNPPAQKPPVQNPPAPKPAAQQPPAGQPPAQNPPAASPPAQNPPAQQ